MASFRALESTCQAVVDILDENYLTAYLGQELEFKTFSVKDFKNPPLTSGVSLLMYRVFINGVDRIPPGQLNDEGDRLRPELPLDMHFMLTAWGDDAKLQQAITGWMMRTIEDHPIVPSGRLNQREAGVFGENEAVELVAGQLSTEDMLGLWDSLGTAYQLSVPYMARNIRIQASETIDGPDAVQERDFELRTVRPN